MSSERSELIRDGFAAVIEGDHDRVAAMFAPDAEVQRVDPLGVLRGREAIRRWLTPEAIEPVHVAVTALEENGDRVLATCEMRMRGAGSGVEVQSAMFIVFTFQGMEVSRMEIYFQRDEAAASAGLVETQGPSRPG